MASGGRRNFRTGEIVGTARPTSFGFVPMMSAAAIYSLGRPGSEGVGFAALDEEAKYPTKDLGFLDIFLLSPNRLARRTVKAHKYG